LNLGGKILLLAFLWTAEATLCPLTVTVFCTTLALATAFAVYAENYARFFERTDLAQSVFLVNLVILGFPGADLKNFLCRFFIPYLASNAILLAVGFWMENDGMEAWVENFYNFFHRNKILATSSFVALVFLMGTPPLPGFSWRTRLVEKIHALQCSSTDGLVLLTMCFYALGYAYFRWILALFWKNSITDSVVRHRPSARIQVCVAACAAIIIVCSIGNGNPL
jgi:NADH:ubiquinone oxidoreductase subunit 2 (subunit N)